MSLQATVSLCPISLRPKIKQLLKRLPQHGRPPPPRLPPRRRSSHWSKQILLLVLREKTTSGHPARWWVEHQDGQAGQYRYAEQAAKDEAKPAGRRWLGRTVANRPAKSAARGQQRPCSNQKIGSVGRPLLDSLMHAASLGPVRWVPNASRLTVRL